MKRDEALKELNEIIYDMSGDNIRKLLDVAKLMIKCNKFEKISDLNEEIKEKNNQKNSIVALYAVQVSDITVRYGINLPNDIKTTYD